MEKNLVVGEVVYDIDVICYTTASVNSKDDLMTLLE